MRKTRKDFEAELTQIDAEIIAHPLASEPVTAAHDIIEQHSEQYKEIFQHQLTEHSPPSLDELGRLTAKHTFSWWNLHRTRKNLLTRIECLQCCRVRNRNRD